MSTCVVNAVSGFDYSAAVDGLVAVDVRKLNSVVEFILNRLKIHDELIEDNVKSSETLQVAMDSLTTRMRYNEETSMVFMRSVEDINKMNDKVSAWSERFRHLEEQHYAMRLELDSKITELEMKRSEAISSLSSQLKSMIETKEAKVIEKVTALKSTQESASLDLRLAMDKLETTTSARITDIMGVLDLSPTAILGESSAVGEPNISGNPTLRSVMVRLKSVEAKMAEILQPCQASGEILPGVCLGVDLIHSEIGKDELILELQSKLFLIVSVSGNQQASTLAERLEQQKTAPDISTPGPQGDTPSTKFSRVAGIHQRLDDLEQALLDRTRKLTAAESMIGELSERLETVQGRWKEDKHGRGMKLNALMRQDTRELPDGDLAIPRASIATHDMPDIPRRSLLHGDSSIEELREEIDIFRSDIELFEDEFEKLRKLVKDKASHIEVEEIATAIVKRTGKNVLVKAGGGGEGEGKVAEIETRLNNYWRNFQDIQTSFHSLKETTVSMDAKLTSLIHDHHSEMQEEFSTNITSLKKKMEELQESVKKLMADKGIEGMMENEQFLRSMVLKLKNEVQKLQGEVEGMQQQKEAQPLIQEINFDDIPDDLEAKKLRLILRQHDQAIRYLATRYALPPAEDSSILGRSQDNTAALVHMEQLRSEMKEILSKQEPSQSLSSKDLDLIKEIHVALDTKIGKEELTSKVDRAELLKIYRQLKRKTDQISEAVKRSETAGMWQVREDVIFSKKRLDAECASCGQLLPETSDLQSLSFQPWGRFPVRSNLYGPGFSHILSSLVSSPSGSISIARKEEAEDRSAVHSPSTSLPNTRMRRRNVIKLPSVK